MYRKCDEWMTLGEVADLIGVQERSLRGYVNGQDGRPVLASKMVRGRKCIQASAAFEHLQQHGNGRFAGLHAPAGYETGPDGAVVEVKGFDKEIVAALDGVNPMTMDPHELSWKLLLAGITPEKIKMAVQVANSIQKKHADAVRAGKNIPPDDVVRMMRGLMDLFVDEIDQGSTRFAGEGLRMIREKFGIDLVARNKDAIEILDQFHREKFGNGVIAALRQRIDDEVRGVQTMEFTQ